MAEGVRIPIFLSFLVGCVVSGSGKSLPIFLGRPLLIADGWGRHDALPEVKSTSNLDNS